MWPNTFWIQMYSLQISQNTTLDTFALYNYWLVKPHWHLITIKVWMKTLIIAPSCAHFWSKKKLHISAGMLYLECNCNHTSASCFCDHSPLWGGRGCEGKIGNPLHQLFYNMHGISSLSLLAGFWNVHKMESYYHSKNLNTIHLE